MRTLIANSCAACTAIVVAIAGSTCRRLTRSEDTPFTRAASTYSRVRTDCAWPRKIRYTGALSSTPSTVMIAHGCTPTAPTNASRMTMDGSASSSSANRLNPRSTQRPCSAAASASGMPMPNATTTREQRRADRDPAARRDAGQHVAAELVGAEPVAAGRAGQGVQRVLVVDRVRLPQRRRQRGEQQQDEPGGRQQRRPPAAADGGGRRAGR